MIQLFLYKRSLFFFFSHYFFTQNFPLFFSLFFPTTVLYPQFVHTMFPTIISYYCITLFQPHFSFSPFLPIIFGEHSSFIPNYFSITHYTGNPCRPSGSLVRAQSGFGEAGIEPGTTFRARASLKTRILVILSTFVFSLYSIQFRYIRPNGGFYSPGCPQNT